MRQQNKQLVFPVIILMVICFVTALALAFTNELTKEPIATAIAEQELIAMQEALPDATKFETVTEHEMEFVKGLDETDEIVGYIFQNSHAGYGGDITVNLGVDTDGIIKGVTPLELNETPGIGMQVGEPEFLEKFVGKKDNISLVTSDPAENEIEGIAGATVSVEAFIKSVNDGLDDYKEIDLNNDE